MKVKVLGTGSEQGNCYLLSTDTETLVLDCGIPIGEIKKGLGYNLRRVAGVVVSHSHNDHSKALKDFENMGIKTWIAPADKIFTGSFRMGGFSVSAFALPHDGIPNHGFLIRADGQKVLYMTDFEYCPYVFKKNQVNHFIVECNYMNDLVKRDLPNYEHKIRGHCSLETLKDFLAKSASDATRTVLLTHMGGGTCIPEECARQVQETVRNAHVDYARKGLEMELSNGSCPF